MLTRAPLEQWYRDELRSGVIDISSSGVPALSVSELRQLVGLSISQLDELVLGDGESLGTLGLRSGIAAAWGDGDPDRVLIGQGSNEVIALILRAVFEPGDRVVVLDPIYHAYTSNLLDIGCTPVHWRLNAEAAFEPDLSSLDRLLTPAPKGIIVNFPHNPTGVTLNRAQQAALVDVARQNGSFLIWDAAFADLVHESDPLPDVSTLYDRAFSIGTFSKAFGLPGLRLGWAIGPVELLARTVALRDATTLFCSPLMEFLGSLVIEHRDRVLDHSRALVREGRNLFLDWANSDERVSAYSYPSGGVTSFVRLANIDDTQQLSVALSRHGILVVPGQAFGVPEFIRVGYAVEATQLTTGLRGLADACQPGLLSAEAISESDAPSSTT